MITKSNININIKFSYDSFIIFNKSNFNHQRVIQIVELPTLQEYETIVDLTADSPLVSLFTQNMYYNPWHQCLQSSSQYNTPPDLPYHWHLSSQCFTKNHIN